MNTNNNNRPADDWTNEDSEAATAEGWDIFEASGSRDGRWQLQRIDHPEDGTEPPFAGDEAAAAHVRAKAEAGDALAKKAIAHLVHLGSEDVSRFNLVPA